MSIRECGWGSGVRPAIKPDNKGKQSVHEIMIILDFDVFCCTATKPASIFRACQLKNACLLVCSVNTFEIFIICNTTYLGL